jgi:class 3 adenylate cyclase
MQTKKEIFTDIVLIDIINFTKLTSHQQLEIVSFVTQSYKKVIEKILQHSKITLQELIDGFVPTGDGFYSILNPKYRGYGILLGMSFNYFSEQISKKYTYFQGVRIAVHTGSVHQFIDILGHKNYIGDGMNECSRYLELKEYSISTVMVSDSAYEYFKKFLSLRKDYEELLQEREFKRSNSYTFKDKHGTLRNGYLVWLRKSGIITPPKYKFQPRAEYETNTR